MKIVLLILVIGHTAADVSLHSDLAIHLHDFYPALTDAIVKSSKLGAHLVTEGLKEGEQLVHDGLELLLSSSLKDSKRKGRHLPEETKEKLHTLLTEKGDGFEALMSVALTRFQSIAAKVGDISFLSQPIEIVEQEIDDVITGHNVLSDALLVGITNEIKSIVATVTASRNSSDLHLADIFATTLKPHLESIKGTVATLGSFLKSTVCDVMTTLRHCLTSPEMDNTVESTLPRLTEVIQKGRQNILDIGQRLSESMASQVIDAIMKSLVH